ncbi:hypothetical protein ES708_19240 [subsurface metagenome]
MYLPSTAHIFSRSPSPIFRSRLTFFGIATTMLPPPLINFLSCFSLFISPYPQKLRQYLYRFLRPFYHLDVHPQLVCQPFHFRLCESTLFHPFFLHHFSRPHSRAACLAPSNSHHYLPTLPRIHYCHFHYSFMLAVSILCHISGFLFYDRYAVNLPLAIHPRNMFPFPAS